MADGLRRAGDIKEIEVTAEELVGKSISHSDGVLPDGVVIALVSPDGRTEVPDLDVRLQHGDHLTFVGRRSLVHEAIERCHPEVRPWPAGRSPPSGAPVGSVGEWYS